MFLFFLISGNFGAIQVHNAGNKLVRRCDMCSNYENQLQGIQIQEAETRDQVSFIRGTELSFSPSFPIWFMKCIYLVME